MKEGTYGNGGLCGSFAGSGGNVSFTNCSNNGTIKGGQESGGLCGRTAGEYRWKCIFYKLL